MVGINDYRHAESLYVGKEVEPETEEEQELTPAYLASFVVRANDGLLSWDYKVSVEITSSITRTTEMHFYLWSSCPETGVTTGLVKRCSEWDDDFEKNVRDLIERIEAGDFK